MLTMFARITFIGIRNFHLVQLDCQQKDCRKSDCSDSVFGTFIKSNEILLRIQLCNKESTLDSFSKYDK